MNKVQQCKLYVVDDDGGYRKSLVQLLESADYSVESFPSAQDFLDSVSDAHETGVLMLDLRMPGMDGFALQKRLNELAGRLEIVFITADAQPGDRERAFRSGAAAFLTWMGDDFSYSLTMRACRNHLEEPAKSGLLDLSAASAYPASVRGLAFLTAASSAFAAGILACKFNILLCSACDIV